MAFPGDRTWKLKRTVPSTMVYGTPSHDCWLVLTHDNLPDTMLTLGGTQGMQQYGTDLAASSDSEGLTRIPLWVCRADLEATPANSRVEIWIRRQDVSDTVDTDIWLWWGSVVEITPAVDENYGRNDVWNGITGTGTPVVSWGIWMFDEDPAAPAPAYIDVSGNEHHGYVYGTITRVDCAPGRGLQTIAGAGYVETASTAWTPGTGEFSVIEIYQRSAPTRAGGAYLAGNEWVLGTDFISATFNTGNYTWVVDQPVGTPYLVGAARNGDNFTMYLDTAIQNDTGWSAVNASSTGALTIVWDYHSDTRVASFLGLLNSAPNSYWWRVVYDNIIGGSFWDESGTVQPAAITAQIYFDGLRTNSEVRIFETPHVQIWTANFAGLTASSLWGDYITFQIQRASEKENHYAWFNNSADGYADPTIATSIGHEVVVDDGYTATQIATNFASAIDGYTDVSAVSTTTIATITNDRNGQTDEPVDGGTLATLTVIQIGGTSTTEIDGIENSTGTSWTAEYQVVRPRRVIIHIMHLLYQNKRYSTLLTTSGLTVPAEALQILDRQYSNP